MFSRGSKKTEFRNNWDSAVVENGWICKNSRTFHLLNSFLSFQEGTWGQVLGFRKGLMFFVIRFQIRMGEVTIDPFNATTAAEKEWTWDDTLRILRRTFILCAGLFSSENSLSTKGLLSLDFSLSTILMMTSRGSLSLDFWFKC